MGFNAMQFYEFGKGRGVKSPYTIINSTYTTKKYYYGGVVYDAESMYLSPDGMHLYLMGIIFFEFALSTPFDLSTMSYVRSYNQRGLTGTVQTQAMTFRPDGLKAYVSSLNYKNIYEYNLSTAWNVSTLIYSGKNTSFATETIRPYSLTFKPDGLKLYMTTIEGFWLEYDLSIAWDISTMVFNQQIINSGKDIRFSPDGLKIFKIEDTIIVEYELSIAWDISTAVTNGIALSVGYVAAGTNAFHSLQFNANFTKMYIGHSQDPKYIYEFDIN